MANTRIFTFTLGTRRAIRLIKRDLKKQITQPHASFGFFLEFLNSHFFQDICQERFGICVLNKCDDSHDKKQVEEFVQSELPKTFPNLKKCVVEDELGQLLPLLQQSEHWSVVKEFLLSFFFRHQVCKVKCYSSEARITN
jgi:hypothetical protein